MPLVDLLDVPKHNPVAASKILWNPLSGHGGHVTLWEGWGGNMHVWLGGGSPGGNTPSPISSGCKGDWEGGMRSFMHLLKLALGRGKGLGQGSDGKRELPPQYVPSPPHTSSLSLPVH